MPEMKYRTLFGSVKTTFQKAYWVEESFKLEMGSVKTGWKTKSTWQTKTSIILSWQWPICVYRRVCDKRQACKYLVSLFTCRYPISKQHYIALLDFDLLVWEPYFSELLVESAVDGRMYI